MKRLLYLLEQNFWLVRISQLMDYFEVRITICNENVFNLVMV